MLSHNTRKTAMKIICTGNFLASTLNTNINSYASSSSLSYSNYLGIDVHTSELNSFSYMVHCKSFFLVFKKKIIIRMTYEYTHQNMMF